MEKIKMTSCDICGEDKEEWELFEYWGGLTKCKIHSEGYAKGHPEELTLLN